MSDEPKTNTTGSEARAKTIAKEVVISVWDDNTVTMDSSPPMSRLEQIGLLSLLVRALGG